MHLDNESLTSHPGVFRERRSAIEVAVDLAASGTVVGWGVIALVHRRAGDWSSPVLLAILTLNLCVAWLFFNRQSARSVAPLKYNAMVVPSVVLGPFALHRSPALDQWHGIAITIFVLGTCLAIASLMTLGKSFAIFPARRGTVVQGPYRLVRHPAYLGELVMACTAAATQLDMWSGFIVLALVSSTAVRVLVEESLLLHDPIYNQYANRVQWRLFPGVW